jgi:transketolase
MSEHGIAYGQSSRGVNARDVAQAAEALLRARERPTVRNVRAKIGRGSPNAILALLDDWWARLGSRLEADPAALQRIPESIAQIAEALWLQALDEGRRRALLEQHHKEKTLELDKDRLELRGHVLSLREAELGARLHEQEKAISHLTEQVRSMTTLLAKAQASQDHTERRARSLEAELATVRQEQLKPVRRRSSQSVRRPAGPKRMAKSKAKRSARRTQRKARR